ncbi:MAG: Inositol 2-dehydrogenase/D-chiro-inositol 3-dehydrogenase [bacterium]|nr:Inositol 2-dehydrogenase/D-chiro-inositol 3-dehydrogenase [bacterium]
MKQVLQSLRTGELAVLEVPEPACPPGFVLVRNAFSFVSPGTERASREVAKSSLLQKARERPDQVRKVLEKVRAEGVVSTFQKVMARLEEPTPLGYSCAGRILEVGEGVPGLFPGMRVACAGAGYANHAHVVAVPKNLVAVIPDGVTHEQAAGTTLAAIALQGLRVGEIQLGENVGVIGLGLLGLLTVQLLKANGCRVLGVDLSPRMVSKALELCADTALLRSQDVEGAALAMTGGHGLDAVIITAATDSNDPVELAGVLARRRGRVIPVGTVPMDVPRRIYYPKELRLILSTSYGPGRYDPEYEERGRDYPYAYVRFTEQRNMASALALMAEGKLKIDPLITHRFSIDSADEAYALVEGRREEPSIGILLDYSLPEGVELRPPVSTSKIGIPKPSGGVSVGIVGAGQFVSGVLLPRIANLPGVKMTRVATARGASAAAVAKRFGIPNSSCRAEDVFSDPDIRSVVIGTRHHQHSQQVVAAVRAGKDVFVEKPLALTQEDLARVQQVVEETGRTVMVGFNRRFAPLAREVREWFSPCQWPLHLIGRINAGRLPQGNWLLDPEEGGGRILGEACHFVDLFQFWTGSSVVDVQASSLRPPDGVPSGEENVSILLRFADGSLGTLVYLSEGASGVSKELYEVHGGGKSAILDDFRSLTLYSGTRRKALRSRNQDKGHARELEHFFESLAKGVRPELSFESCAHTTEVMFRILERLRKESRAPRHEAAQSSGGAHG